MSMLSRAFKNPIGTAVGLFTSPASTIANLAAPRAQSGGLFGQSSTGIGINVGGPSGITIGGSGSMGFGFPGATGTTATGKRPRRLPISPNGPPKGWHLAKNGQFYVRNRHMNMANGRANRRAIRRLHGAEKQLRRIFQVMHHKKPAVLPKKKGAHH